MNYEQNIYSIFRGWLSSNYKRTVAFHLYRSLELTDAFLHEIRTVKGSLWQSDMNDLIHTIASLNQNRVFRNRNRDVMPWLDKLNKALSDFVESEAYQTALNELGITPVSPRKTGSDVSRSDCLPIKDTSGFREQTVPEKVSKPETPLHRPVSLPVPQTSERPTASKERPADKAVRSILEKCVIRLDDAAISGEAISRTFLSFLSDVSTRNNHNVGITLHTGSVIFDALAVLWAAVSSLLANETSPEELVRSLQTGDWVTKDADRYRFEGLITENSIEYALLVQDERYETKAKVPISQWAKIIPYQGKSTSFDRRGVKGQNPKRTRFYTEVLGLDPLSIPSVTDTSTVFVMSRERADMLIKGLSISHNHDTFKLLDLVTASWYTDNKGYTYSGNSAKNEPVLKFTGKVSTGSKLLRKKGGNRHIGLFVCGDDELRRGESELPELLDRKALQYVHVLTDIDAEQGEKIVTDNENAEVFACTKDFLLSCPLQLQDVNVYTRQFSRQVDAILDHETSSVVASGFADWNTWKAFRQIMFSMKESDYESEDKNDFIVNAWSLFNLLQTAVFPIHMLDDMAQDGNLPNGSPTERLGRLKKQATEFPRDLEIAANHAIDILETCYSSMNKWVSDKAAEVLELLSDEYSTGQTATGDPQPTAENDRSDSLISGKYVKLVRLIGERRDKRICIVVPRKYFETVIRESELPSLMNDPTNLIITTANRFDRSEMYDTIIVVGEFRGKRFDSFRCMSAREVITLLYKCEQKQYRSRKRQSHHTDRIFNERSYVQVITEESEETTDQDDVTEDEIRQFDQLSTDIDSYIDNLILTLPSVPGYIRGTQAGTNEAEIVAVATFDSGERVFFTPYYEACVYDDAKGNVSEKRIKDYDLCEGDLVVFTRNDDGMHDIVDDIMKRLIERGRLKESEHIAYGFSKAWKNRLRLYMQLSRMTPGAIARKMNNNGVSITSQTIRIWVDPESHTVGPRESECIRQIGLMVGDENMISHPEETIRACKTIRSLRGRILEVIKKAILNKLSGKTTTPQDPEELEIYSRIDSQADILRVESFVRMKKTMLTTFVNRPVSLQ